MAEGDKIKKGFVKQVLSGDSIILQGPPTTLPPKEITLYLSNCSAPRLARRPNENSEGTTDEPYAWEAREFLRQKIVGKTVVFVRDFLATSGREHGTIYLGGTCINDAENINLAAVSAGYLDVKTGKNPDENAEKLLQALQKAKDNKLGRWAEDGQSNIRNITWQIDDVRGFVDAHKGKAFDAVIEQVRDGSTVRATLLPNFENVTVLISGIKSPQIKGGPNSKAEPFGEEAKYFVESRLLQRDVKIYLEGVNNQNFVGSVIHPRGNIAEFVLSEGLAKCSEWTLSLVTNGGQKLRELEKKAKQSNIRIWKNYVSNALPASERKVYQAKVIEIGLGDNLTVLKENGEEAKVYFASLRAPKKEHGDAPPSKAFRPLYDIPYMFEAREFLRKKLIGKRVQLTLDYVQPKQDAYPEKYCFSVTFMGQNVGEQLVANGYAKVVRHRQDDENRASNYDDLLQAEQSAEKEKKGIWNEKNDGKLGTLRVAEIQGDLQRSKTYLSTFQRGTRPTGIVEFVASGSRIRVYVPKENIVITAVLSGITCPRNARVGPGGKVQGESEPYADEAYRFTRHALLQREVQIEVDSLDKSGGFITTIFVKTDKGQSNIAELLIEQGLASVHFTAERLKTYNQLVAAEKRARDARINIWKDYVEEEKTEVQDQASDVTERKLNLKKVVVSEVQRGTLHFAVQDFNDGPKIEELMNNLQRELGPTNVAGNYTPKRGEICAAVFTEVNSWHRVKVESIKGGQATVVYIDFGNKETLPTSLLAALPSHFNSYPPLCREYKLALVQPPNDPDFASETDYALNDLVHSVQYLELNPEYKGAGGEGATLFFQGPDGKPVDVGRYLVEQGLALAENRKEKRFQHLVSEYQEAEKIARQERRNIWRYGDFTGQDV